MDRITKKSLNNVEGPEKAYTFSLEAIYIIII